MIRNIIKDRGNGQRLGSILVTSGSVCLIVSWLVAYGCEIQRLSECPTTLEKHRLPKFDRLGVKIATKSDSLSISESPK